MLSSETVACNEVEGFLLGYFFRFKKGTSVVQAHVVFPQGKIKICKRDGKSSSPIMLGPL